MASSRQEVAETLTIISHSPAHTQRLGTRLGELLRGGELLLLEGGLGTGKTTFTQGLAKGMGITEVISSPTFTLLKEYTSQPPAVPERAGAQHASQRRVGLMLYHFDLYRLDDASEILDLGFDDYFAGSGVCVVEWADKADHIWHADYAEHLRIRMQDIGESSRGLLFRATGAAYCTLLAQFQKHSYATLST